jgi:palmitoyltransferase ZDHHC9/14/18
MVADLTVLFFLMQRNYRFFYMFVFSTTLLCLYVFGFCWVLIVKIRNAEQITIWKAMAKSPASIALIVYTFIAVWFVGGLSVFHLYLMSTNQVKTIFTYLTW